MKGQIVYLKAQRKEKEILRILYNILCFIHSIVSST